jgi:hypothetical protein
MNTFKYTIISGFMLFVAASCSLNTEPLDTYSEITQGKSNEKSVNLADKEAVINQRQVLYQRLKDMQEYGYLDLLLLAESHSDNAYAGSPSLETTPFEVNSIEGSNSNLKRDWNGYMDDVAQANILVCGIDSLNDPALSEADARQYRSEGLIFRALSYFNMVRIWGNVPVVTWVGAHITAENIDEVYPTYFPKQSTELEVYQQIEKDLLEAVQYAPDNNPSDKTLLTKSVARALLAKVYAEKPLRDYNKVIDYVNQLTAAGFNLEPDYSTLFSVTLADPSAPPSATNKALDAKIRNSVESILEVQYPLASGNWATWMFGRPLNDWNNNFTWAKWITPSRDLLKAFQSAGDTKRLNETIVYYSCSWNIYYPANNYAFMYKTRSAYNSIYKLRYADLLLLKAEALIQTGDLAGGAAIINQTRNRVGLGALPAQTTSTKENAINTLLDERRLELALEGQRWFDLVRLDKVEEVMNAVYAKDPGRPAQVYLFDANSYKLPIPQDVIDINPNLVQNPGY